MPSLHFCPSLPFSDTSFKCCKWCGQVPQSHTTVCGGNSIDFTPDETVFQAPECQYVKLTHKPFAFSLRFLNTLSCFVSSNLHVVHRSASLTRLCQARLRQWRRRPRQPYPRVSLRPLHAALYTQPCSALSLSLPLLCWSENRRYWSVSSRLSGGRPLLYGLETQTQRPDD